MITKQTQLKLLIEERLDMFLKPKCEGKGSYK